MLDIGFSELVVIGVVAHIVMPLTAGEAEATRPLGRAFSCMVTWTAISPEADGLSARTLA